MKTFKKALLACCFAVTAFGAVTPIHCQDVPMTKEAYEFLAKIVNGVAWYLKPAVKKMCVKAKDIEWKKVAAAMQKLAENAVKQATK